MSTHATTRKGASFLQVVRFDVVLTLGIVVVLVALALPTYAGIVDQARASSAGGDVDTALPAIEDYALAHNGYAGLTTDVLRRLAPEARVVVFGIATATDYCIRDADPALPNYFKHGPGGPITTSSCSPGSDAP